MPRKLQTVFPPIIGIVGLALCQEIRRLPDGCPLSFSPDGELVVVCPNPEWLDPLLIRCSPSEDLQIIEQKSGQARYTVRSGVPLIWLDARRVLVGRADGAVWEVDLPSGIERKVWSRPRATIRQIMLSPDQRWLAVQYGGSVDIVERMSGIVSWSEAGGPVAFSPEGSWLRSGCGLLPGWADGDFRRSGRNPPAGMGRRSLQMGGAWPWVSAAELRRYGKGHKRQPGGRRQPR